MSNKDNNSDSGGGGGGDDGGGDGGGGDGSGGDGGGGGSDDDNSGGGNSDSSRHRHQSTKEFMVELVYDLIFPGRTCAHLRTIGELDEKSISSTRTLSSFSVDEAQLDEDVDLVCESDQLKYLAAKPATMMTKKAMMTNNKWQRRFDGM